MFRIFNVGKLKQKWMQALVMGRTFVLLSIGSAVFFIVLGLGGLVEQKLESSPLSSMKGVAAQLSTRFFVDMMAMEMPKLPKGEGEASLSRNQVAQFLVQLATNVNPFDPKSLLAGEVPGLDRDAAIPLRLGVGNQAVKGPEDYPLPANLGDKHPDEHGGEPTNGPDQGDQVPGGKGNGQGAETVRPPTKPESNKGQDNSGKSKTNLNNYVFIYHSHNRESWNPELEKQSSNPNDAKTNITLVGKRLQEQLEKQGIGAVHSNEDYSSSIKGYNWNMSYKYSKQTVKEAMAQNKELQFFFDIHRDALRRKDSTVEIKGKSYAQVYFIIGHRNPNWKENESFASEIHEKLEDRYPGISRGIWGKSAAQGNGEYNQSLSPNSVVIEVGGIDNTLEESYRTADVLADLIAEIVRDLTEAKPVNKPVPKVPKPAENKAVDRKTVLKKQQQTSAGANG
ncbi:stage II sporulation protein P [Paenibacillus sp. OSY-SE]|uniref:stage II sporulation protein P n=1 Tax=Paenibacillus sp. OSY-SE TaxID=1196323 RepID=UPI0003135876|nr:stage II sporulation protein P [Paenibacillus sp. OSY-SE]